MDVTIIKVIEVRTQHCIYKPSSPATIVDEGGFYRVAETYIFD